MKCAAKWRTGHCPGAPGQVPNEHVTLGNSLGALRYNSSDYPVSQRSNS
jgi:hypothetical protein